MTAPGAQDVPKDVVAIFHASFHPTQGNTLDWSAKSSDDLNLEGVEFCVLPSGLHTVDRDVIYFTHAGRPGISVFNRRATSAPGHRGFRLASLSLLLAPSPRPRPWRHLSALTALADTLHASAADADTDSLPPTQWDAARSFFAARECAGDGDGAPWAGWDELRAEEDHAHALPALLRTLGPSSLALYKHVLGRRRILLFCAPPVARAGALCRAAADTALLTQLQPPNIPGLKPRAADGVPVLGMVTLHDIGRMQAASERGRGWVACTTDALFLERPQFYDLVVDLTPRGGAGARPALFASRAEKGPGGRETHKLQSTRFTWSDIRLWTDLERILASDSAQHSETCPSFAPSPSTSTASTSTNPQWSSAPPSAPQARWADTWRVYEDACVLCAGLWARAAGDAPGGVRLGGADELGIVAAPAVSDDLGVELNTAPRARKARKRASGVAATASAPAGDDGEEPPPHARTTHALLARLHLHTTSLLTRLAHALPPPEERGRRVALPAGALAALELGPLSAADARFVGWLGEEWAGCEVGVRRGWREVVGWVFGVVV